MYPRLPPPPPAAAASSNPSLLNHLTTSREDAQELASVISDERSSSLTLLSHDLRRRVIARWTTHQLSQFIDSVLGRSNVFLKRMLINRIDGVRMLTILEEGTSHESFQTASLVDQVTVLKCIDILIQPNGELRTSDDSLAEKAFNRVILKERRENGAVVRREEDEEVEEKGEDENEVDRRRRSLPPPLPASYQIHARPSHPPPPPPAHRPATHASSSSSSSPSAAAPSNNDVTYPLDLFVDPFSVDDFLCEMPDCGCVVSQPLSMNCTHQFCGACIRDWIARTCPSCRISYADQNGRVNHQLVGMINKKKVKCRNHALGCAHQMEIGTENRNIIAHRAECKFEQRQCKACKESISFDKQKEHEEFLCPELTTICTHCDKSIRRIDMASHVSTPRDRISGEYPVCSGTVLCPRRCRNTNGFVRSFKPSEIDTHTSQCKRHLLPCVMCGPTQRHELNYDDLLEHYEAKLSSVHQAVQVLIMAQSTQLVKSKIMDDDEEEMKQQPASSSVAAAAVVSSSSSALAHPSSARLSMSKKRRSSKQSNASGDNSEEQPKRRKRRQQVWDDEKDSLKNIRLKQHNVNAVKEEWIDLSCRTTSAEEDDEIFADQFAEWFASKESHSRNYEPKVQVLTSEGGDRFIGFDSLIRLITPQTQQTTTYLNYWNKRLANYIETELPTLTKKRREKAHLFNNYYLKYDGGPTVTCLVESAAVDLIQIMNTWLKKMRANRAVHILAEHLDDVCARVFDEPKKDEHDKNAPVTAAASSSIAGTAASSSSFSRDRPYRKRKRLFEDSDSNNDDDDQPGAAANDGDVKMKEKAEANEDEGEAEYEMVEEEVRLRDAQVWLDHLRAGTHVDYLDPTDGNEFWRYGRIYAIDHALKIVSVRTQTGGVQGVVVVLPTLSLAFLASPRTRSQLQKQELRKKRRLTEEAEKKACTAREDDMEDEEA